MSKWKLAIHFVIKGERERVTNSLKMKPSIDNFPNHTNQYMAAIAGKQKII